jgi:exonuclease SbcD
MRILHTSDWHIGRTFHGHATVDALHEVLQSLARVVRDERVDVVIVAGDIFDSAMPSGEHFRVLTAALTALREAGAVVVATSGNHDSAARLGFQASFARLAGIHVLTDPERILEPVTVDGVHIYGIPYLEPSLVRHLFPGETLRRHNDVLGRVMQRVRDDAVSRGGRYVVVSHSFVGAVGAPDEASDVERDITAGGLDIVSLDVFDGPDYVALGHIHGRAVLAERIRYSGAPLHYSFSEAGKPRGVWIVDLDDDGFVGARWVDLPIPRGLSVLTGTIDELLALDRFSSAEEDWVSAILTDDVRPLDAMARLRARFAWCATLEHRPATTAPASTESYAARIAQKSDLDIVDGFLGHVRNGQALSDAERDLVLDALGELDADGVTS